MPRALRRCLVVGVLATAGLLCQAASGTGLADEYDLTIAIPDPAAVWSDLLTLDLSEGERQPTPGLFRGVTDHRWTADGKHVVYRARRALWVADVDGTSTKLVTDAEIRGSADFTGLVGG